MATTFIDYTGDGNNNKTFTFPSYQKSDVKVEVDNVVKTPSTHYNITNYTTTGGGTVEFTSGNIPASGISIRIYRDTDISTASGEYDPKATFQAGSSVRSVDLNNNQKQALYAIAEEKDQTITTTDIKDGAVTSAKIYDGTIVDADIANTTITGGKLVNDTITATQIAADAVGASELADNSVASANIIDGAIVNADINASAAITYSKLEDVNSSKILVGNGSNKAAPVDMSGDITITNAGVTTIGADAVQIGNISDTETTLTANSDAKIPTSKAVADHVVDVVNSVGGFVIVADKDNFPASHPDPNNDAGTVLSITNPNGLTVSSNTSSNGTRTGGSSTVTINNIPTDAGSTLTANYTMLVQTTSTEHTYDFYKFLAKDGDVLNLSNDINDFAARYRVGTRTANNDSSNDDGDLFFDTSANKMYVYDGAYDAGGSWGEVTSTGEFKELTVVPDGATSGSPVFGSNVSFDLRDGSNAASITNKNQLIVVLNGVVQKSNSGSWSSSEEGFYLEGTNGIKFCTAPPANSTIFVTQMGSAVSIPTPGDETVTEAKLNANAPTNDYVLTADSTAGGGFKWAENVPIGGDTGVRFNDNVSVAFGTGTDNDMLIKHTPHVTVLEANDGGIAINADEIQLISNDTAGRAVFLDGANDRLELGYDGHHSVLINTTGVTFLKTQSTNDDIHTYWGNDADLSINYDGTNNLGQIEINNVPLQILTGTGRDVEFWHDDSGDNDAQFAHIKDTDIWCKGHFVTGNEGELRLNDADSSKYVGFKSPATVAANKIWTLPAADGSANQALTTNGSAVLSWSDVSSTTADGCIYENDQTISNAYTIAAGKGAHSVGPLTLNATVTVNGRWVIS